MKLTEAWGLYERDKKLLNYSPITLKSYKIQCRLLREDLNDPDLEQVTRADLKEYLSKQVHLKPQSLEHRIKFIRSFYRCATDEGYCNKNPAATINFPKAGIRIPKFLHEENIEDLREACASRLERAIFEFLYTTGCRIGEAVCVNIKDLDWNKNSLIVHGKGDKEREVYFNTTCRIWLRKYLGDRSDEDMALFVTERAPHRMSIAQMRYILKRIAKRAGIDINVYPHRLRHSYATHLLNNGAPIEAIQQLLGHSKAETTQVYAQMTGELRREVYNKYF